MQYTNGEIKGYKASIKILGRGGINEVHRGSFLCWLRLSTSGC